MSIKSFLVTVNAGIVSLGLAISGANAAEVTLADYLVTPNPGDSWTYITNMDSTIYLSGGDVFFPAGTEFTVTEPWYVTYSQLPSIAETGQAILVEPPNISIYLDFIPELTVPAGTFNNVLMMAWLDSNYVANSINTLLGIDPAIDEGVTDVNWFALGIGEIKGLGVRAFDGGLDADWDLISYSIAPVPNIKANGSDGPLQIAPGTPLQVDVSLTANNAVGQATDWWLVAEAPDGRYWYDISGSWVKSAVPIPTYTGALFDLASREVLNSSNLPAGSYRINFGVDTNANGILDFDVLFVDTVDVYIQSIDWESYLNFADNRQWNYSVIYGGPSEVMYEYTVSSNINGQDVYIHGWDPNWDPDGTKEYILRDMSGGVFMIGIQVNGVDEFFETPIMMHCSNLYESCTFSGSLFGVNYDFTLYSELATVTLTTGTTYNDCIKGTQTDNISGQVRYSWHCRDTGEVKHEKVGDFIFELESITTYSP